MIRRMLGYLRGGLWGGNQRTGKGGHQGKLGGRAGLFASILKGQGHQGIFSLVRKAPYMYKEIVNLYWSISRAPSQGPGGMRAIALVASSKCQAGFRPGHGWKKKHCCR